MPGYFEIRVWSLFIFFLSRKQTAKYFKFHSKIIELPMLQNFLCEPWTSLWTFSLNLRSWARTIFYASVWTETSIIFVLIWIKWEMIAQNIKKKLNIKALQLIWHVLTILGMSIIDVHFDSVPCLMLVSFSLLSKCFVTADHLE